ncbi:MAG: tyrosine-type recombinase/integrase [Gammaproteobacteria bacterium]|nr:tyrosine-type recombinase/integrase [Gammaproteobacteria bacterium]
MKSKQFIPWNKGKLTGQKPALKLKEVWAIQFLLKSQNFIKELAMFNLAIDSKLRSCDLVKLKVADVTHGPHVSKRAIIVQQKTKRPVQFELTKNTRESVGELISSANLKFSDFLFKSRLKNSPHISVRQYARIVKKWVLSIGLDPYDYGTHSLRRTKASLIYRQTKNLRAVQLLLGHSKLESTIRYLGVEIEDALDISEHIEI